MRLPGADMSDTTFEQVQQLRERLARRKLWLPARNELRFITHAEDVLGRHAPLDGYPDFCSWCESQDSQPVRWPCVEVAAVLKVWIA